MCRYVKIASFFLSFILGIIYGILPLLGVRIFDRFRGMIILDNNDAVLNIIIAFVSFLYILYSNKLSFVHTLEENAYVDGGFIVIVLIFGIYYGLLPLFGFRVFDRFDGWINIESYSAITYMLLAFLLLLFVCQKYVIKTK